jgi:hypothetical protein
MNETTGLKLQTFMAEERRLIACDVGRRRRYTVIRYTRRRFQPAAREPPAGFKHAQSQHLIIDFQQLLIYLL